MSLPAEGLDHEATALPIGGAALVRLGEAPPLGALSSVFQTESLDLVTMDPSAIYGPAPVPRPVLIVWMPVSSPEELLRAIVAWRDRSEKVHPVALLGCAPGASAGEVERVLAAGFDDFVGPVVSPREIAARVRALARRVESSVRIASARLRTSIFSLDLGAYALWIGGRSVRLTPTEMQLMRTLVAANGRTLTREELLDAVWGGDNLEVGLRAVDNLVWRLRRKAGDSQIIVTVRGAGFRLSER